MELSVLGKKREWQWGGCLAQIQSGVFGQEKLGREGKGGRNFDAIGNF